MSVPDARRITKAVIPAAGKGTRLRPLTKAVPKELMPLGAKPVLEHIVDELAAAGIADILLVISDEKLAIRSHFGESDGQVRFHYAFQAEQWGLADAIHCAKEFAGREPFGVALGDALIDSSEQPPPFQRVLRAYQTTPAGAVIAVQKVCPEKVGRYGVVRPASEPAPLFRIDAVVEKPTPERAPSSYAIAARYAFDPVLFDCIRRTPPGAGGEYQLSDAIDLMLRDGHEVWCVALGANETRRDIGNIDSYLDALRAELKRRP